MAWADKFHCCGTPDGWGLNSINANDIYSHLNIQVFIGSEDCGLKFLYGWYERVDGCDRGMGGEEIPPILEIAPAFPAYTPSMGISPLIYMDVMYASFAGAKTCPAHPCARGIHAIPGIATPAHPCARGIHAIPGNKKANPRVG
ncbi:hypothetical protein [Candidatus Pelagadaptatus aseana]|uniref:hypothetical protein n=1 Tax=Candidatus Pelagadaptatus aseana TaxID=3120508 RepID=UPI003C6EBA67